ncbi:MAG: Rab family GTPase [Candidatus Thorarchaeota archaeon]|jgi:small GTP-binding protein
MAAETVSWQFKVCLIGDGYVGKTSIRRKYIGEGFRSNYIPTLGVDFAQKYTTTKEGDARLVIWDIAGQTQFQSLRKRYYEGCSGLILVYSVVDRESFDNASKWLVEAHGYMKEIPSLTIVANKVDLRGYYPDEDIVSHDEGAQFTKMISEKLNTPSIFIETSALTGENIDEAFNKLTLMMINPKEFETTEAVKEEPVHEPEPAPSTGFSSSTPSVTNIAKASVENTSSMSTQEAQIGQDMTELIELRARLKRAEQDLRDYSLQVETKLLNLKNTVHVKKIMYEHLRQQLAQTRQEWADAYDEHVELDKQKKEELEKKFAEIKEIRMKIDEIESTMKKQVQNLDFE